MTMNVLETVQAQSDGFFTRTLIEKCLLSASGVEDFIASAELCELESDEMVLVFYRNKQGAILIYDVLRTHATEQTELCRL